MTFKYKPEKIKFVSKNTTLDDLHKQKLSEFEQKRNKLPKLKLLLDSYNNELNDLEKICERSYSLENNERKLFIKDEIKKIQEDIEEIDNHIYELEYFTKTNDILVEYYNIIDKDNINDSDNENENFSDNYKILSEKYNNKNIDSKNNDINSENSESFSKTLTELNILSQKKRKIKKETKKRIKNVDIVSNKKNILSFFEIKNNDLIINDSNNENKNNNNVILPIVNIVTNKSSLLEEYINLTDKTTIASNKNMIKKCQFCNIDKILVQSEGCFVCPKCGDTENIIVESEIPSHKDSINEKPRYPYKRLNHFQEWLNQFQAKESTEIPDDIYQNILNEIKIQRLDNKISSMPYKKIKKKVRDILKKLKYTSYYEHISYIISKLTGKPPPILNREIEEKIKFMFKQIQEPFKKYCPKDRINFLNYSYIFNKLLMILDMKEYAECFELLKSKDKLRIQDNIWKNICYDLGWKFYPSI